MKKILLLVCFPLLLPLAAQADVSVDINVPGVSLHLGAGPSRLLLGWLRLASTAVVACAPWPWFWVSAMRAVCIGTADAGNLRRRVAMSIASRNAAAIRSTAIAIIATAVMTIGVTMIAAMTAAVSLIRRATPAHIVNP